VGVDAEQIRNAFETGRGSEDTEKDILAAGLAEFFGKRRREKEKTAGQPRNGAQPVATGAQTPSG